MPTRSTRLSTHNTLLSIRLSTRSTHLSTRSICLSTRSTRLAIRDLVLKLKTETHVFLAINSSEINFSNLPEPVQTFPSNFLKINKIKSCGRLAFNVD